MLKYVIQLYSICLLRQYETEFKLPSFSKKPRGPGRVLKRGRDNAGSGGSQPHNISCSPAIKVRYQLISKQESSYCRNKAADEVII